MIGLLYAQALPGAASPAAGPMGALGGFLPLIVIFFIFYFLLIRPQQKREKEHKKLLNALKKDDKVITSGGIYGTVINVKPDVVELKIDDNAKVQILKSAIATVINPVNPVAIEAEKKA
ncbi:MAG: preprotein translocase subunit YajC [Elusimicrobia bacterium RIFOXYA2_FULL_40_6]|nr:MAG: preprotein translocase subunit YajC [Elusimicrobia bacterium RIFOXYA2_FULL_40_6]